MIQNLHAAPHRPNRVVILGASGFIGTYLTASLRKDNIPVLCVSSQELDLTDLAVASQLENLLRKDDAVVFLSVIGPNRGHDSLALIKNVSMAETVSAALKRKPCKHLIYVSSEAVYSQEATEINSTSVPQPANLYGAMHLVRELMLQQNLQQAIPMLTLRPTQIYGARCTHNAYGPCRFLRSVAANNKIELFGDGADTRDFIYIDDVIVILKNALYLQSTGCANVASGNSHSFAELAAIIQSLFPNESIEIVSKPRVVPLVHRHFDIMELRHAYPEVHFTSLYEGVCRTRDMELTIA